MHAAAPHVSNPDMAKIYADGVMEYTQTPLRCSCIVRNHNSDVQAF